MLGQGGTLGSSFVLGAGAAVSAQLQDSDRVVAVFFGDGAASRGTFHEAALQASVWKLPVVWICENNGWALSAPITEQSPTGGHRGPGRRPTACPAWWSTGRTRWP